MKICLINSFYDPFIMGGAEIYTKELAEGLSGQHEVIFITSCPFTGYQSLRPLVEQKGTIKVIRFFPLNIYYSFYTAGKPPWKKGLWHLINFWNLHSYNTVRTILKNERPDIIHSHNIRCLSPSIVSAIDSLGIPHVHTLHDYELMHLKGDMMRGGKIIENPNIFDLAYMKINRPLTKNIRSVIGPINLIVDIYSKYGYFKNAKKYIIPWGRRMDNDSQTNKTFNTIEILFVGNLTESKGINILLAAFAKIGNSAIRLHIVGQGPLAHEVSRSAATDSRIKYYGQIPHGELRRIYSMANILVIPSLWYENLPSVAIEALSFGTPIIASAIGGLPDIVEDGYNGLLFTPGEIQDLTRALNKAVLDVELLKKLGKNARESAQKYNINNHIEQLLKVYQETIA